MKERSLNKLWKGSIMIIVKSKELMIWTVNKKLKSLSKKLQGKSISEEKAHRKKK